MTPKTLPDSALFARIRHTLAVHDPTQECILLGSAGIVAHYYQAEIPSPIGCSDVDTLCSKASFDRRTDQLLETAVPRTYLSRPTGMLALRGAQNSSLHAEPTGTTFAFTTTYDMSDNWTTQSYEAANTTAVRVAGMRCRPLADILISIAQIGRGKDLILLGHVLPHVAEHGLLPDDTLSLVKDEHNISEEAKNAFPNRYYARIDT